MQDNIKRINNPPNPFHARSINWTTVDNLTVNDWAEAPPIANLEIYEEKAKSILSKNDSPDIFHRYSVNPYRGCFHACAYCYARPSHQYLDFGAGTDFERKIIVKINAHELLEKEISKKNWQGSNILFSGNTDCYQPLELSYELTRKCLLVCAEHNNPVSIITKSSIVQRDIDVFKVLNERSEVHVTISIPFFDNEMARAVEPGAPLPSARFRALQALADAGISCGIAVAPLIPGLNDNQISAILIEAKRRGAKSAFMTLVRLPGVVKEVFFQRINEALPLKVNKVRNRILSMKGGRFNRSEFGMRMKGEGVHWEAVKWMFDSTCKKLGLNSRTVSGGESQDVFMR